MEQNSFRFVIVFIVLLFINVNILIRPCEFMICSGEPWNVEVHHIPNFPNNRSVDVILGRGTGFTLIGTVNHTEDIHDGFLVTDYRGRNESSFNHTVLREIFDIHYNVTSGIGRLNVTIYPRFLNENHHRLIENVQGDSRIEVWLKNANSANSTHPCSWCVSLTASLAE